MLYSQLPTAPESNGFYVHPFYDVSASEGDLPAGRFLPCLLACLYYGGRFATATR